MSIRTATLSLTASLPKGDPLRKQLLRVLQARGLRRDVDYEVNTRAMPSTWRNRSHLRTEQGKEIPLKDGDLIEYLGTYRHGGQYQSDPIPTDHFELVGPVGNRDNFIGQKGEFWPNEMGDASRYVLLYDTE